MTLRSNVRITLARLVLHSRALTRTIVRLGGTPTLFELSRASQWHTDAESFTARFASYADEALAEADALQIISNDERRYPDFFAAEKQTVRAIYALVRVLRPRIVVETGVADGLTTASILAAMARNECGHLHSFDIADDVGAFVTDRTRWTLHVVDPDGRRPLALLDALPPVDIFLHDSNHSYRWQRAEYEAAWSRLERGGVLLSDDVDSSYAFLDFAGDRGVVPLMLLDRTKVFGALRAATQPTWP